MHRSMTVLPRLIYVLALACYSLPLVGCGGPEAGPVPQNTDADAQAQFEREQMEGMEAQQEP